MNAHDRRKKSRSKRGRALREQQEKAVTFPTIGRYKAKSFTRELVSLIEDVEPVRTSFFKK